MEYRSLVLLHIVLPYLEAAKIGPFHAEPYSIETHPNNFPDMVTSYFYLQQISQTTALVMGELEVKKTFGPLKATLIILSWAGNGFKRASGSDDNRIIPNACKVDGTMDILDSFEPEGLVDREACIVNPGIYNMSLNFDEGMHKRFSSYPYNPICFVLDYLVEDGKSLFGFSLQVNIEDLRKYEFIHPSNN